MIFSLPSFLPWLVAALLPWVLHLFLFRKAETVYFPSLYFLKQCYGWSSRLKLRRLLLLLTRSALILYFILGMLDPRVERAASTALNTPGSGPVLLVLDDRPAMRMKLMARPDSLFDAYRQSVLDDLERRPQAQPVAAVSLSELSVLSSVRFVSPREAAGKIRAAAVQTLNPPVQENLRFALDRFHTPLLFFSPFQMDIRDPKLERVGPALPCEPNLTLFSLKAPAQSFVGQPVSIQATVIDLYGRPADAMVRLRVDGGEVGVSASEQGRASFLLTALPVGRRLLKAEVVSSGAEDGYPEDDARTVQVTVTADRAVGFAAGNLPPPLEAALRAFDHSPSSAHAPPPSDWESKQRMVVLDFQNVDGDLLERNLARGLDVVLFADAFGSKPDLPRILSSLKLQISPDATFASIDAAALQHMWTDAAPSKESGEFPAESASRDINLIRKLKIVPQKNDNVLASFSDGSPAVVRHGSGPGSVTLVAFSAADPVLQADPAFLLFVQGLISGMSAPAGGQSVQLLGASIPAFVEVPLQKNAGIPVGPTAPSAAVRLVNSAASATLTLGYSHGQFFAEIPSPAPPPGLYRLLIGDDERAAVHLYPASPSPLALPVRPEGVRRSIEFDSFFFWIAILLMAVELLLLRQLRSPAHAS